jgi:hypothetical protein
MALLKAAQIWATTTAMLATFRIGWGNTTLLINKIIYTNK